MNEKRFGEIQGRLGDYRRRYLIQHISTAPKGWLGTIGNARRVPNKADRKNIPETAPYPDLSDHTATSNSAESAETCAETVESSAPTTYRSPKVSAETCYQTEKIQRTNAWE